MKTPRYVATVKKVREVMLVGSARWEPWAERLRVEDLVPLRLDDGRAEIQIMACGSSFRGVSFRECVIAVALGEEHVFLIQAYNSRRFFAWSERTFFGTPYDHARVTLETEGAASLSVDAKGVHLAARMGHPAEALPATTRKLTPCIAIPSKSGKAPRQFHGLLEGPIREVPFNGDHDRLEVRAPHADHALQLLADSDFRGLSWHVGVGGVHARTRSVRRKVNRAGSPTP